MPAMIDEPYRVIVYNLCRWMDGWLAGWMDGWMAGWLDGWMAGWLDGWMDGWIISGFYRYILS